MKIEEVKCHCGKQLHYKNAETRRIVDTIIKRLGRYITVQTSDGREFLVDRHYIALHGIKAKDIPDLGFEEIKK